MGVFSVWQFQQTLRGSIGLGLVKKSSPAEPRSFSPSPPAFCLSLTCARHQLRQEDIPRAPNPQGSTAHRRKTSTTEGTGDDLIKPDRHQAV